MSELAEEEALLSREELDALLAEMPEVLQGEDSSEGTERVAVADADLSDANEGFAYAQGLKLSNRHQRVLTFTLVGQRKVQMDEMAELMLPTDLLATFNVQPANEEGYLLLSRPFFFQMLSMSFGSGPTIKPTRPPTREYSRIERRFYERIAREMIDELEIQWQAAAPVSLGWRGLVGRSSVADGKASQAVLATFEVKGFSESCRVRIAVPASAFPAQVDELALEAAANEAKSGVSVLDVPLRLRAQIGTAELSLADVGALRIGQTVSLKAPSDGNLLVKIGGRAKFKAVAGVQGARRAVQLTERTNGAE